MGVASGNPALHWSEAGPRGTQAVVLLHSLGTDGRIWRDQIAALRGEHRVVVPDARGHGASEWAPPLTVDGWVEDLERVLEAAEVEHAVLVGLSMGGVQAVAYAAERPERLDGLVLADTFAQLDEATAVAKVEQLAGTAERDGMEALADEYVRDTFTRPVDGEVRERVRDAIAGMPVAAYVASAEACFGARLTHRLGDVRTPTLVLWGTHDTKTPRALAERLAEGIDGARLAEIPDAGHLSNLENPRAFTDAVAAFARETVGARARATRR